MPNDSIASCPFHRRGMGFGALWFDAHRRDRILAIVFLIVCLAVLGLVRRLDRKLALLAILFGAVLTWWFSLKPSNEAIWQPDVAQLAWAEIERRRSNLAQCSQL